MSPRFQSEYDEATLFDVVREVSLAARPHAPESTAPDEYDAELARDGEREQPRWARAPSAEATRRRLGRMGWYQLLELVHSERSPAHYLAIVRRKDRWSLTRDDGAALLQTAARALNQDSLRPGEYDRWRDERVAVDRRRWASPNRVERMLPTAAQIDVAFRPDDQGTGWEQALADAGLRYREHTTSRGLDPVLMLDRFLADVGCLPWSMNVVRVYAAERHLSLAVPRRSLDEYVDEARRERTHRGMWTPPAAPPPASRPRVELGRDDSEPSEARQYDWPNLDVIVESIVEALDLAHGQGTKLTQPVHRELAKTHPGRVAAPSIVQNRASAEKTTAAALREQAVRLRRDRARGAAPPRTLLLPCEAVPQSPPARPPGRPPGRPPKSKSTATDQAPPKSKPTEAERAAAKRARRREQHKREQAARDKPVKRERKLIYIPDLIEAGMLEVGQELVLNRDGREHHAEVTETGRLLVNGTEHHSPSGAATAISGRAAERGWQAWRLASDPAVSLNDLRKRWANHTSAPTV